MPSAPHNDKPRLELRGFSFALESARRAARCSQNVANLGMEARWTAVDLQELRGLSGWVMPQESGCHN